MINCALISQEKIPRVVGDNFNAKYSNWSSPVIRLRLNVILSRLNVIQTVFGANIEFSMRTFLFKTQGSSADEQQQTISCNLYLDLVSDVASTQADDCTCYSEGECPGKPLDIYCI